MQLVQRLATQTDLQEYPTEPKSPSNCEVLNMPQATRNIGRTASNAWRKAALLAPHHDGRQFRYSFPHVLQEPAVNSVTSILAATSHLRSHTSLISQYYAILKLCSAAHEQYMHELNR